MECLLNVWNVFDLQKTHSVEMKHLRTIMRALDFNLNDEEMSVIRKMIDPESSGVIKFENLKLVMEDKMKDKDTPADMMQELRHLDRDKDDRIPVPEFKQFMSNMGMKMSSEEIEKLVNEVDKRGDGFIYIDEMAERLCPPKV